MTLPMPDESRLVALRRMKIVATGLIVAAAGLFVLSVSVGDGHGLWGYLQAAAEASMIGGLADWFAVTALFRHPLGIPIPHTAIIPRKKDQIGSGLAGFVQRYFLTGQVVGDRLATAEIPRRVGEWLADPVHAARVADEIGSYLRMGADLIGDDDLRQAVGRYADRRLRATEVAPIAVRVLDALIASGEHQVALAAGLRGLRRFLDDNYEVLRQRMYAESPEWVPKWLDDRVFDRGFSGARSFLDDVSADQDHELRRRFDKQLRDYVTALREDPARADRLEQAKQSLLDHPDVRQWLSSIGTDLKSSLLAGSVDPDSEVRQTIASVIGRLARSLQHDDALRARIDELLRRGANHVLTRYGDGVADLISDTVSRWDATETSRRLELQVGRDLQFIRVNGTVVGALVGVVIHAISQLF